jgi:hypothetical protein
MKLFDRKFSSRPMDERFETAQGHRAKKLGREMSQGHFMAKILFLHQVSCRVNQ